MTRHVLPALAALALTLAACGTTAPSAPTGGNAGFDTRDFAWSTAGGRGRIDGQLTLRRGGAALSCQTAGVVLIPETPWVRERMQRLYRSTDRAAANPEDVRTRMPAQSPNFDRYVRKVDCDAQGRFAASGLADGAYFVITNGVGPNGNQVAIMRRVEVRNGATVRVEL
jgi:hypothetical protein